MLISQLISDPILFFIILISLIIAFSVHEYFHAFAAYRLGDPTAKLQGRLTLNPISHIDPLGFILLLFLGFGWAKPTPVNPFNFSNKRWGSLYVSIAGPLSNFGMAIFAGLILHFGFLTSELSINFLVSFAYINVLLGVFNLLPFAPLDGFHIFTSLFRPERFGHHTLLLANPFMVIIAVFLMMWVMIDYVVKPITRILTGGLLF